MELVAVLLSFGLVTFAVHSWLKKSRVPLPPGPKGWPIIGNVFDIPAEKPWKHYHEWSHTCDTDIVHLQFPTGSMVILDSVQAAQDLFEKRSYQYSDRARSFMLEKLGWYFNFGLLPYGPEWRLRRKMFHQHFHQEVTQKHRRIQLEQARAMLSWIVESPQDTPQHIHRMIVSIILLVTYGKKIASLNDSYLQNVRMANESFVKAATPGEHLVEILPFLQYIPGATAKSMEFVKKFKPYVTAVVEEPYSEVKAAMDAGTALPSMARSLIEDKYTKYDDSPDEATYDQMAQGLAGVAFVSGADTTTSVVKSILLAMALFPEVQRKAQSELDIVVGPHRLPEFSDLDSLPYIRAVVMEAWRWMPIAPLGFPRGASEEDTYKGYRIPKGTLCFANIWAMTHNPADYPDPEHFKPERFIGADGHIDPTIRDPSTLSFGFGRRICPGQNFATDTVSIFTASVLHVFDISAGVDKAGKPIQLGTDIIEGLVPSPKDVPCGLSPRFATAASLIRETQRELEA